MTSSAYHMLEYFTSKRYNMLVAEVAELADAHDSKSCSLYESVGSTPTPGTNHILEVKQN